MIRITWTYLPPSILVAVFLVGERPQSLWLSKFQTFSLVLLIVSWKNKRNCMSGLYSIENFVGGG